MIRWLRALPRPCGLMACNDDLGKEVIEACKLAGLAVPDDIAVVGVDNDELVCGFSDPPMSSVAVNFEHAGYEAASVLDRLMRGMKRVPFRIVVRASRVVPRRSTDIVAVEDSLSGKGVALCSRTALKRVFRLTPLPRRPACRGGRWKSGSGDS